ncbi:MAG: 6,7-dimethyl-8-ribityllumazine synthase [Fibrobacter sp.]|nr:6,7-dimethyl-8-ribityllumazine synthase [Fibrobacter sp.]
MTKEVKTYKRSLDGKGMRIAIAVADFNTPVTGGLLSGAISKLEALGVESDSISVAHVPGAFELTGVAKRFVDSKSFDAVIVLGAVIRGETPHFDCVVNAVTSGTAALAANGQVPVIFGVLTTDNVDQAMARSGLKAGNKGADCAESAVEMVNLYKELV